MENLKQLKQAQDNGITYAIDDSISIVLSRIGMPAKLRGYRYVKTAILYIVLDNEKMYAITKDIYPEVAKYHNSTSSRVERNIRSAIERTWTDGNVQRAIDMYGYNFRDFILRPTNSEFIAEMVEIIMKEYR